MVYGRLWSPEYKVTKITCSLLLQNAGLVPYHVASECYILKQSELFIHTDKHYYYRHINKYWFIFYDSQFIYGFIALFIMF